MPLRLFQIVDTHERAPIKGLYFTDKKLAKAKRKELNGGEVPGQHLRYVVSPGPDHHNYREK